MPLIASNQGERNRIETAVVMIEDDDVTWRHQIFFLFVFLFSYIIFDLGLQFKSNKFVKVCRIPNIQNRQLGTIFGQKQKLPKYPFVLNKN